MSSSTHDAFAGLTRAVIDAFSGSDSAAVKLIKRTPGSFSSTTTKRTNTGTEYLVKAVRHATRQDVFRVTGGGSGAGEKDVEETEFLIAAADLPAGIIPAAGDFITDTLDVSGLPRTQKVVDVVREVDQTMFRVRVQGTRTG